MIHFNWGQLFLGDEAHLFSALAAFVVAVLFVIFGRLALKNTLEPAKSLSFRALLELFTAFIVGLSDSVIGPSGRKMVPVFGAIFLIIWLQNLFTLIPGFSAATDNLNSTFAFGVCAFGLYNFYGIKHHKWAYIRQFLGPIWAVAPFFLFLEIISHIMRPVSLGLRLYGNMTGDHAILSTFVDLVPIGVPVIFYFLGLFVCTMQAFVFTMLTMIYFSMAVSDDH